MPARLLILGGTSEASALARRLAGEPDLEAVLSLAGATANPAPAPIPQRVGGFGGPEGLAAYLRSKPIDLVVDATHPFAARMSANALSACSATATPLVVFTRPPWVRQEGDRWNEVATMEEAVDALGASRKTVFLTQGRLQLATFACAPQHRYIVRAIDPPAEVAALADRRLYPRARAVRASRRTALTRDEKIEILVTKNSGGRADLSEDRGDAPLGVEVAIVRRPKPPEAETLHAIDSVMAWIASHRGAVRARAEHPGPAAVAGMRRVCSSRR